MPIDTPYNRMVTNQYNDLIRNKVAHEEATLQTVIPSPAGRYVNGYEPVMMGSGVGLYKKSKACPKGHEVCSCPSGAGISATICGSGRAHGEYDRVVGGANLGLQPAVRVELALGAGMRGDATSKHGCLDMYQTFAHGGMSFNDRLKQSGYVGEHNKPPVYTTFGGRICNRDMSEASIRCREGNKPPTRPGPKMPTKKTDGTLYHKSVGGMSANQYYRHRNLVGEHANKNKALRQLGNGEGGKRGRKGKSKGFSFMDAVDTVNAVDSGLNIATNLGLNPFGSGSAHGRIGKNNKSPLSSGKKDDKKKDSIYTIENLVKGVETAEKVGNAVEKVANLGSKAWSGIKGLFGKGSAHGRAHGGLNVKIGPQRGSILGEKRTLANNPMLKAIRKGYGGKSRSEIVKDIMKKMGLAMCDASKYVKEHGLY
jgi:hypothetical protein